MTDQQQQQQQQQQQNNQQQQQQTAWYEGKADAETIGHWDNKGWNKADPATVAIEATKQARSLQQHFGVPAEQLIKLPKDATDEAGWTGVYQRLGVPKEAKEYDLTGVKGADGNDLDAAFADSMRAALLAARVPKDRAGDVVKAVVKHQSDKDAAATAERTAKLTAEKTELAKNWGTTPDKLNDHMNRLTAMQGAKRLGVDPETVALLENTMGYAKVMEMFRKIGAGTTEDTFIEKGGGGGSPTTKEGAAARLAELQADKAWAERLLKGDAAARREFDSLTQLVAA